MNVKEYRISHNLTQARLAEICGVTLRTIQNWEARQEAPKSVEVLLGALDTTDLKKPLPPKKPIPPTKKPESDIISYADGVPYYDEDFILGFTSLGTPVSETPEFLVNIPKYNGATLWCNATGHSMEPEINNGDIVALQLIDDPSFLLMGDIYALVTTNGLRTIKRVRKSDAPECYKLVPSNPGYDTQDIPIDKILRVYRVIGNIHGF